MPFVLNMSKFQNIRSFHVSNVCCQSQYFYYLYTVKLYYYSVLQSDDPLTSTFLTVASLYQISNKAAQNATMIDAFWNLR